MRVGSDTTAFEALMVVLFLVVLERRREWCEEAEGVEELPFRLL
jgi:hypothetical protein